ncbi:MAG: hypothetical protein JXR07_20660 [Reichenbachiella sp.]
MKTRQLGKVIGQTMTRVHIQCPHCKKFILPLHGELEEISRVNLDVQSAQVTYNLDCSKCEGLIQTNIIIEEKKEQYAHQS